MPCSAEVSRVDMLEAYLSESTPEFQEFNANIHGSHKGEIVCCELNTERPFIHTYRIVFGKTCVGCSTSLLMYN